MKVLFSLYFFLAVSPCLVLSSTKCLGNGAIKDRVIYLATDIIMGCGTLAYRTASSKGDSVCRYYDRLLECLTTKVPKDHCTKDDVNQILSDNRHRHRGIFNTVDVYCMTGGTPMIITDKTTPMMTTHIIEPKTSMPPLTTDTRKSTISMTTEPVTAPGTPSPITVTEKGECTFITLYNTAYGFNRCLQETFAVANLIGQSAKLVCIQYMKMLECVETYHPDCPRSVIKRVFEDNKDKVKGIFDSVDKHDCQLKIPAIG